MSFVRSISYDYFKTGTNSRGIGSIYSRIKSGLGNCKVKNKIIIGFGTVMVINLVCIVCLLCNMAFISYKMNSLYNGAFANVETTWNMRVSLVKIDRYMYRAIVEEDIIKMNKYLKYADEEEDNLKVSLNDLKENFIEDKSILDKFEGDFSEVLRSRENICTALNKGDKYEARTILNSGYKSKEEECEKNIGEIYDASKESAEYFIRNSEVVRNVSVIMCVVIILLSGFTAFIIGKIIISNILEGIDHVIQICGNLTNGNLETHSVYKYKDEMGMMGNNLNGTIEVMDSYIENISYVLRELAQGNLNVELDMDYRGDFSQIKYSLENIINSLKSAFISINSAANIVSVTSKEIECTSESLSQGADEQTKAIENVVEGIIDMSDKIKNTSGSLALLDEFFNRTSEAVNNENMKMNNLMEEMGSVNKSVSQISNITNAIESISRQTDLVALNAAIESARAGEEGKGFAVVAGEVRKLANETSEAVKNTAGIINSSIKKINDMDLQAAQVMNGLSKMIEEMKQVAQLVNNITTESKEQLNSVNNITGRIDDISQVIEYNLEIVDKSNSSVNELVMQAVSLEEQIGHFNY